MNGWTLDELRGLDVSDYNTLVAIANEIAEKDTHS
jgi:hypothetical protein